MRKVATFEKREDATAIFFHLQQINIDAQMEEEEDGFEIWVRSEDQILVASKIIEAYREKGPEALVIPDHIKKSWNQCASSNPRNDPISENDDPDQQQSQEREQNLEQEENAGKTREPIDKVMLSSSDSSQKIAFYGPITRLLLIICAIFYFASSYQNSEMAKTQRVEATLPILSPINQLFLYDYPDVLKAISKLVELESAPKTSEDVTSTEPPQVSEEEKALIKEIETTPVWIGFYNIMLHKSKADVLLGAPMFTSIGKGEVWRIFTPMFLHAGILHFVFNMLWLWLLGKMVEGNMSLVSFVTFVLLAAAFSNTAQYLMTGPFFMGISGVIAALAGYVWSRKKVAPWEIYPIDRGTLIFLGCFIFGLLGLQIVSFFLQLFYKELIPLNFANTAHISGVFFGLILGRTKLFQKKV